MRVFDEMEESSMRLPEKLMGYVEYEGVNYPFNFDKVSFMITLFPPSIEHHRQTNSLAEFGGCFKVR